MAGETLSIIVTSIPMLIAAAAFATLPTLGSVSASIICLPPAEKSPKN